MNLLNSDCLDAMRTLSQNSIDTIITDPPYGLTFMGKDWDKGVPGQAFWLEMLRVAKPGAMLLSFGGTRTFHRMTVAIEDAGWEIRDCMMWLYGSGFPKSHNISLSIDKANGVERKVIGQHKQSIPQISPRENFGQRFGDEGNNANITEATSDLAKQWDGWGTALKPAWEPIIVAMKPLDGTFAQNAEKHGVAGLNVDGARIETTDNLNGGTYSINAKPLSRASQVPANGIGKPFEAPMGRWPANLILDEDSAMLLDMQTGELKAGLAIKHNSGGNTFGGDKPKPLAPDMGYGDSGGASRFFYCAKASKSERGTENVHPTVKPLKLMEYLCTLTKTPTGGIVLDPFMGSGTTGVACRNTGRDFIGIEKEEAYFKIAQARIESAKAA